MDLALIKGHSYLGDASLSPQLQSCFFGLPREIRDIIYSHFWIVSGLRQHVFEHDSDGRLTHYPCQQAEIGAKDTRNEDFEELWFQQQAKCPKSSMMHDGKWARRMSSGWNEHWYCEEAMREARSLGRKNETLFLPSLLTCKRMYHEVLPLLYSRTTLILTSLPLSHSLLVSNPSPHLKSLRSLELSLDVPYAALHNHQYRLANHDNTASAAAAAMVNTRPNFWAELCAALSSLGSGGALRDLRLRLDLVEDDRFWWEVRETWALSALRGPLRSRVALDLPELSVDTEILRSFQYAATKEDPTTLQQWDDVYNNALPTAYPSPPSSVEDGSVDSPGRRGEKRRLASDFKNLVRYDRRRWMRDGAGDGVQPRLEFPIQQNYATMASESNGGNMDWLFRGMLMC